MERRIRNILLKLVRQPANMADGGTAIIVRALRQPMLQHRHVVMFPQKVGKLGQGGDVHLHHLGPDFAEQPRLIGMIFNALAPLMHGVRCRVAPGLRHGATGALQHLAKATGKSRKAVALNDPHLRPLPGLNHAVPEIGEPAIKAAGRPLFLVHDQSFTQAKHDVRVCILAEMLGDPVTAMDQHILVANTAQHAGQVAKSGIFPCMIGEARPHQPDKRPQLLAAFPHLVDDLLRRQFFAVNLRQGSVDLAERHPPDRYLRGLVTFLEVKGHIRPVAVHRSYPTPMLVGPRP